MDKSQKITLFNGEEVPIEEMEEMISAFHTTPSLPSNPPKDYREFENRLWLYFSTLRHIFFGPAFSAKINKTLK
ncbi:hypothetical protein N9Y92_04070, partial [Chlamydiales bacterium]|nr:hypothetical protein [Chlamydiales bacterium]